MKIEVRSPLNYDRDKASLETGLVCDDPSLTVQSEKDECDINFLLERFGVLGVMPQVRTPPEYGDFTGVSDYQSALNALRAADAAFMELPAKIRAEFDHNPQKLLDFLSDESNRPKAEELGLVAKAAAEVVSPTGVATEAVAQPAQPA